MGRIIMVVTVWLVMAAMMLVIALPVIAKIGTRALFERLAPKWLAP
jgi:hypothetical protein